MLKVFVFRNALSHIILSFWPSGMAPAREECGAPLTGAKSETERDMMA
jgi:hypothetical protein